MLGERYEKVMERLDRAVQAAGRKREEITLIAVSKLHPAEMVAEVAALGQVDFGENYVQEALEKRETLDNMLPLERSAALRWHMIGHVQSRKAAQVAGHFDLVHTLDSERLAQALEKRCAQAGVQQRVLIEVNVGEESQKSGVDRKNLSALADYVQASCPHLELQGLMCIPPVFDAGEAARPYFALLRTLAEKLRSEAGLSLPHLSMGMSGDFEWAVMEGATFVRVGTDIFGPRPPKKTA
ncbi:MAG TPA: YggS family pyridoxal phosphate-dependent enzyme [Candidatus Desulfovibrio intestinipullorum]|uniref:Pyridoxal phosphate homeostasis protein n=1 Tax=Candidatus Desulfovibrio intestinipullorum TaxID=2838536 RepID=A0A9D1PX51_9BACT|nr:YggS family pyridoxal phosphate-dependent enzyme [Candidatus Desulfovibrio intestinipullorum]